MTRNLQLAQEKNSQFTCSKKYIARRIMFTYEWLNGDIKLFLAVAQATKQVHAYSLTIILILQINKTHSDPNGRFIICDINTNSTNGTCFTLCNLYTPSEERPEFFRDISNYLQDFQCNEIIIGGDFNLVMDIKKDKRGGHCTHKNSLKEVKGICETWDVIDIKRVLNREEVKYILSIRR